MILLIIVAVASLCVFMSVQYFCTAKAGKFRQELTLKGRKVRDLRYEKDKLVNTQADLARRESTLRSSVDLLDTEIEDLENELAEVGVQLPSEEGQE